jgi:hypothetical protein
MRIADGVSAIEGIVVVAAAVTGTLTRPCCAGSCNRATSILRVVTALMQRCQRDTSTIACWPPLHRARSDAGALGVRRPEISLNPTLRPACPRFADFEKLQYASNRNATTLQDQSTIAAAIAGNP